MDRRKDLLAIYDRLLKHFGHRGWWPADGPPEMMIGIIFAQNVSWLNAKKAVDNLKSAGALCPEKISMLTAEEIVPLIRSSRFYNQKAKKIEAFTAFYCDEYGGDLCRMREEDPAVLRKKLLAIKGLGKETVDFIRLYACDMPVFVVNAYTRRILVRYGMREGEPTYDEMHGFFTKSLPTDVGLYNDLHTQIVHLGNVYCKPQPLCDKCPLVNVRKTLRCKHFADRVSRTY
jgi:endonuclease-3 related protein